MKTLLIGFEIKKGEFTSEKTGEVITYNNRVLRFITDTGSNGKDNFGYAAFNEKFKLNELAEMLGVAENETSVDSVLQNGLQKEWDVLYSPGYDSKMVCSFVRPKK